LAKDTIFVGDKNDTLTALRILLTRRTQWIDYMEEVLELITIKSETVNNTESRSRVMTTLYFPYRIKDITLPQCNKGYIYICYFQ